jgi:hypothetical protein
MCKWPHILHLFHTLTLVYQHHMQPAALSLLAVQLLPRSPPVPSRAVQLLPAPVWIPALPLMTVCHAGQYTLQLGSATCTACDTKMAFSGPGSACADYYICEPGKPTVLKFCPEPQCYAPFQQCCAESYGNDGNAVCIGSVLA